MKPFGKISRGMGIGGWMTNYKRVRFLPPEMAFAITVGDREHFEKYITRWDIQNIRSFGMDHIRIPFDQVVLEAYDHPFCYREDMLRLLEIRGCKVNILIINMYFHYVNEEKLHI